MNIKNILLAVAATMLLAACGGDFTPKPQAYLRIDMPQHTSAVVDTSSLPFLFEQGNEAELTIKKEIPHEVWVDLNYPRWDGVVFLSYKHLTSAEDLRGQTDTSSRLLESHYQFTSGIESNSTITPTNVSLPPPITLRVVVWLQPTSFGLPTVRATSCAELSILTVRPTTTHLLLCWSTFRKI